MTRVLYLDDEHERHLELAARYLRTLAAVELAHALDDPDEITAILASIDPFDLKIVGQELELLRSLYRVAPIQIAAELRAGTTPRRFATGGRSDEPESPSSVAFFPESLRVPSE